MNLNFGQVVEEIEKLESGDYKNFDGNNLNELHEFLYKNSHALSISIQIAHKESMSGEDNIDHIMINKI